MHAQGQRAWLEDLENRRLFAIADEAPPPTHTSACACSGCCRPTEAALNVTQEGDAGLIPASIGTLALEPAAAAAARFALRVNFAPLNSPAVRGYKLDYGASYSRRGNGLTYGWNSDHRSRAQDTDSPKYDSPRAESGIDMSASSRWGVKVPNGWYEVRVLMGAPDTFNADYRVNVEGQLAVKGTPFAPNFPWVEGVATVRVTDGQLTLSAANAAQNNFICSIGIQQVAAPVSAPQGAKIAWSTTGVQSPIHRAEAGAVRVGDKLYVFGGFTAQYERVTGRMDILNLKTNQWSRGRPLPGAQTHFGVANDGRYIYLAGGQYGPMLSTDGTNEVWRYDTVEDRWTSMARLPAVRFGGQMQYLDGRLHFVGGNDNSRVRSRAEHFIFDLNQPSKGWYVGAALPMATDHHSSIVVNNQLYVLGGEVEHGTSYLANSGMYRYDARANRWIALPSIPEGTSHVEAATLTDGKRIFIIAGQVNAQQLTSNVYSYDIARGRWEQHTSMPTARKAGIAWITGNRLYYMTGDDASLGEPRTTYVGVIG